jgi:hypothetical protein
MIQNGNLKTSLWLVTAVLIFSLQEAYAQADPTSDRHKAERSSHQGARQYGGFYSREKIANLRNNCFAYEWAKQLRDEAIEKAATWVAMEDKTLWASIPGQDLPRCIDVTFDRLTKGPKSLGCLKCGNAIKRFGNYPYDPDFRNKPWKLTCPSCGSVFPTNDFGKYYLSAIDEKGLFNPAKGDRSLLYNVDHPDPDDPLHKYGVDDGFGYIDENGRSHKFIGYYAWKYWMYLNNGLEALAAAFLFTGEQRYAHKAAILLDRIADVYPDMDWKPYADRGWYHSDGGTNLGKIEGSIWETGVVQKFAESYDKILSGTVDSPEIFAFLKRQSQKYQLPNAKGTRELFIENVDRRILHTAFEAVLSRQIRGNQGMHQLTVAMCAVALNTEPQTSQWLDWLFTPDGGAIPGLMLTQFDRDGTSDEGAPGYALMWGRLVTELASWLISYPAYTKHNIFEDYPQFSATFLAAYRLAALGRAIPNIGDSGATGLVSGNLVDPDYMALGYYYTRDPEIAIAAYRANGNSAQGLGRNIYSQDPDALSDEIAAIAEKAGARPEGGYLMSGFGMALLECGTGAGGIALACNYGRTIKHAHPDILNFDLFAFGHWLTPDHGYPEFATRWPSNVEWTGSTISHNTVFVNKQPQKAVWGGYTRLFKQLKGFGVFELDGKKAYPELKDYIRTMFLVCGSDAVSGDSNAYAVDIFRVNGGTDHVYSFHGPPGEITNTALELKIQEKGTYAGENIEKGAWATDFPVGYSHLYNVRTDNKPPSTFVLDWKAASGYRGLDEHDDVHLRLHALTEFNDVALADGDPPQNKPGNPERLGYALMHRTGDDVRSTFVSVIEPYRKKPFIKDVQRLGDYSGEAVAVKIERMDGGVDYVLYNRGSNKKMRLPNGISMTGTAAFISVMDGRVQKAILVNGSTLRFRNMRLTSSGGFEGKVVTMNKELTGGGWLTVDKKLPTDGSLNGHQIMIQTSADRDACYAIHDIQPADNGSKIFCGPITFVRGYKGEEMVVREVTVPRDYSQGYLYDFEEGASFEIPVYEEWKP